MKFIKPNYHIAAGVGHAFTNWCSARVLTMLTKNTEFVHVPINAPRSGGGWDGFLNFGCGYKRKGDINFEDRVVVDEFNHKDKEEIEKTINFIENCDDNTLLKLSYDQFPGPLFEKIGKIREELKEKYRSKNPKKESNKTLVSIHVRRGDISPKENGGKWIGDGYYFKCMDFVRKNFSGELRFNLISQGRESDFSHYRGDDVELRISEDPKKSFKRMTDSDILVTSNSGYSILASFLCDGWILYQPFPGFAANYTGWIDDTVEKSINMKKELKL